MKFTVLTENLRNGILLAEKTAGKKVSLPILSSILCSAEKGKILLTSTNLETAVEVWVGGKVEREGKVAIPARVLSSYISFMGSDQVTLSAKGNTMEIASQKGKTRIHGYTTEDFPLLPRQEEITSFTVPADILRSAVRRVVFAAAASDIKPEIASVFFSITPRGITVAATDSFRLAEQKIEWSFGTATHTFLLPVKSAHELIRLLDNEEGDVSISLGTGQIVFLTKRFRFVSRLTEGQYPDYQRIVPSSFGTEVVLSKDALGDMLRVAGLFVSKLQDITLSMRPKENMLDIKTANTDIGENTASIPARITGDGFSISFNYRYIMDGFGQVEGDIVCGFTSDAGPVVIRAKNDPSYFYIVMPMKV